MIKRIIALLLTVVLAISMFAACGNKTKDPTNQNTTGNGNSIEDQKEPTKQPVEEQKVENGNLLIYIPNSDFIITASSDKFQSTYDTIKRNPLSVDNQGTEFVTAVGGTENVIHATISDEFAISDIVTISPVATQTVNTKYSLMGSQQTLEVMSETSDSISLSFNNRYAQIKSVLSDFTYSYAIEKEENEFYVSFTGFLLEAGDVGVSYDGNVYTVASTVPIAEFAVITSGFSSPDNVIFTNAEFESLVYEIAISSDGEVTIIDPESQLNDI